MPGLELPFHILASARTPLGAFGGQLRTLGALPQPEAVLRALVHQTGRHDFSGIGMGCAFLEGLGPNPATQAAQAAGITGPAWTLTQGRTSGLMALDLICRSLENQAAGIAGGFESLSQVPYLLPSARWGRRMGEADLLDPLMQEERSKAIHYPSLPPPIPLEVPSRQGPMPVTADESPSSLDGFWAEAAVGLVIARNPATPGLAQFSTVLQGKNPMDVLEAVHNLTGNRPLLRVVGDGIQVPEDPTTIHLAGLPPAPSGLLLVLALIQALQSQDRKQGAVLQSNAEGQTLALILELS